MNISDALLQPATKESTVETGFSERLIEAPNDKDSCEEVMSIHVCGPLYKFSILSVQRLRWLVPVAEQIQKLMWWEQNWDSYGGLTLHPVVIQQALAILERYLPADGEPPGLQLTPGGGLQLEWRVASRLLDIEVEPNMKMSWFFSNRVTGKDYEQDDLLEIDALSEPFELFRQA